MGRCGGYYLEATLQAEGVGKSGQASYDPTKNTSTICPKKPTHNPSKKCLYFNQKSLFLPETNNLNFTSQSQSIEKKFWVETKNCFSY